MQFVYNTALRIYELGIWLASFFNYKARLWIKGRRDIFEQLERNIPQQQFVVWVHCASLGEFEQGRPVIEAIKKEKPELFVLLTFFSPSGYEVRKNYNQVDFVGYLPMDTPNKVKKFIQIVQPNIALFVKYEFWKNYLQILNKKGVKSILISAIFHSKQPFFDKFYSPFFQSILHCFDKVFVQNTMSAQLLEKINIQHYEIVGDTRIDRVINIAKSAASFPIIEKFKGASKLLICGSTWQPDEAILCSFIRQSEEGWKFIFAPHNTTPNHIQQIEKQLQIPSVRYSTAKFSNDLAHFKVLIIDTIGMLSQIYQYGTLAYIGGGFGAGIHNTLEPAAFHLPIIIGPKYQKFEEANQLVKCGGMFVIQDIESFEVVFDHLQVESFYQNASKSIQKYIKQNQGATDKVMQFILPLLP